MDKPLEPKVETSPLVKLPATELLNNFMKEKGIQLVFGDMRIRQLKDGAIIVERPIIGAEYI